VFGESHVHSGSRRRRGTREKGFQKADHHHRCGGGIAAGRWRCSLLCDQEEDGEPVRAAKDDHAKKKDDHKTPPTFVALDPFTVNLSDKEAERYAQIGVTLEVDDAHFADEMKAYLPAIRAGILMVLAHKSAAELLEREGKEKLAREIMRVSVKPMGIEIEDEEDEAPEEAPAASDKPKKKKKKKKAAEHNPVQQVLFSSFIIQ